MMELFQFQSQPLKLPPQLGICLATSTSTLTSTAASTATSTAASTAASIVTSNQQTSNNNNNNSIQVLYENISNTNNNDTSKDKSCSRATIRHISPYYIEQKLLIGNLAKGKKLGDVLGLAGRRNTNTDTTNTVNTDNDSETNTDTPSKTINDNDSDNGTNSNCTKTSIARSSIVKNKTLIDWWPKELVAGRLTIMTSASASASASSTIFVVVAAKEDYIIQDGDILVGRYHFHEQSILYHTTPTTVYEDSNFIIVNKPGGIDCLSNPDGHRVLNSLPGIMLTMKTTNTNTNTNTNMDEEKTVIIPPPPIMIMPAHRIDNVVSGLVCCGKTNRATKHLSQRIYFKQVTKTYIARIQIQKDRFCTRNTDGNNMSCSVGTTSNSSTTSSTTPNSIVCVKNKKEAEMILNNKLLPIHINVPLGFDKSTGCAITITPTSTSSSCTTNNNDDKTNDDKTNNTNTNTKFKESYTTILKVLSYCNDGSCIIAIRPHTGRKHQLRKHLQSIGLPIVNDRKYNTNTNSSKSTYDAAAICSSNNTSAFGVPNPSKEVIEFYKKRFVNDCEHCIYVQKLLSTTASSSSCCSSNDNDNDNKTNNNVMGPCLSQPIWLHSWRYKFNTIKNLPCFVAPPPEWATGYANDDKWVNDEQLD